METVYVSVLHTPDSYGESGTQVHITVEKCEPVSDPSPPPEQHPISRLRISSFVRQSRDSLEDLLGPASSLQAARPRSNVVKRLQSISETR